MPVAVPAASIAFLRTQTGRRRLAAEQTHGREVGSIADRGGISGVARVGDLAPEPRPNFCRRAHSLFGLKIPLECEEIPCSTRVGNLGICRQAVEITAAIGARKRHAGCKSANSLLISLFLIRAHATERAGSGGRSASSAS
jgi:hypothetical protein